MAKVKRMKRRSDIAHFRKTSMRTKAINRTSGNTQSGIRF